MYVNWLALFEVAAAISAVCIGLFGGATLFVRVLRCFEAATEVSAAREVRCTARGTA